MTGDPRLKQTVGQEVAYCGRVPVRVRGTCLAGDILAASGLNDGTAVAVPGHTRAFAFELTRTSSCRRGLWHCITCSRLLSSCCWTSPPPACLVVGVAMQDSRTDGDGISLVEVIVTPPSLTKASGSRSSSISAVRLPSTSEFSTTPIGATWMWSLAHPQARTRTCSASLSCIVTLVSACLAVALVVRLVQAFAATELSQDHMSLPLANAS